MNEIKEKIGDILKEGNPISVIGAIAAVAIWAIYDLSK